MTTTTPSTSPGPAGAGSPASKVYANATNSLLAQNPAVKTIDAQLRRDEARLSNLGKMALALDDFRRAIGNLAATGLDMTASSSHKGGDAKLAGAKAVPGAHTVEVKQLAQAQQLASKSLPDKDMVLGSGGATVIKIESGSSSVAVRIGSGNNTLDGIAKAMRDAGLDAQVVKDGKGFALNLTGKSGVASGMRIDVSGDPVLQGLLSYGNGGSSAMTQKSAAQDAQLVVDGKAMSASANKIDTAIAGVSLTLNTIGKSDVNVIRDPSAIAANVKNFVAAFNTVTDKLGTLRTEDGSSDTAMKQVMTQMGQVLDGADPKALAEMGITRKNGGLVLDEAKLKTIIAADPERVTAMFIKPGSGLAEQLAKRTGQQLATNGTIANQAAAVKQDVAKLNEKKDKIADAVNHQAAALAQQYALAGAGLGASTMFGNGQVKPMSLFDFLA